jgi:diguanylate cyclase (GGDEF)-like protein
MAVGGPQRNAGRRGRALRYAFLGNCLPIAVATATDFSSHHTVFFIGAAGAMLAPFGVTLISRRHRIPFYFFAYEGIPALTMMQAYSGGAASGYAVLLMMAMIWFGLQATDRELIAGLLVLAACAYLPMLVFGPPAYPLDWGHATLLVLVGCAVAGSLRAVTRESQALSTRLRVEAVVDDLTGLLNRRGWRDAGGRELARAKRSGRPVGMLLLDLDNLKEINDTRGHDEGDRVLRETADRMRLALRAGDVLARLGGDEFVVLLTDATHDEVAAAAERLSELTPELGSFSAGLASWDGSESLEEMLRRCDVALYSAKTSGRASVEVAPQSLDSEDLSA